MTSLPIQQKHAWSALLRYENVSFPLREIGERKGVSLNTPGLSRMANL